MKKSSDDIWDKETLLDLVRDILNQRTQILEEFCQAYIAETGLMPSEIELCEVHRPDKITYFFRRREDVGVESD